jgi:Na+-driven multidrug efflux pump
MRAALQNMGHAGISMFSGFLEVGGRIVAVAALPVFIGETTVYIAEEIGWAITAVYLMICYIIQIRKVKERMIS